MSSEDVPTQPTTPDEASQTPPEPAAAPAADASLAADSASEAPPASTDEATKLREELAAMRREVEQALGREGALLEKYQRLAADFDNFRRRAREENTASTARGRDQFLQALLPVLDNLELALQHTDDQGLKLLARQLQDTLVSQGVQVLNPEGEAFDAKQHEAIGQEAREGVKSGTVVTVAQKGYATQEGRVLRPARVIVAA